MVIILKKRLKTGLDILLGAENRKISKGTDEKNEADLALNISDIKPNQISLEAILMIILLMS